MKARQTYYGNGLEQSEYLKNVARLQDFNVIENDWKELFQWVISVGHHISYFNDENSKLTSMGISNLWDNQIFTILIEIAQKNIESYKENFIQGGGTIQESKYTYDLQKKIQEWIRRINNFLNVKLQSRSFDHTNLSIQIAETIKKQLEFSLESLTQPAHSSLTQPYYNMLNTINEIGKKGDLYIKQIEESGDIDPSLALLLTFVRNYSTIVEKFNQLILTLPTFYKDHILNAKPRNPLPDITQLVINPIDSVLDTYIPKDTAFLAGKNKDGTNLLYRATTQTRISHIKLKETHSFYLKRAGNADSKVISIQHKSIDFFDPQKINPLFIDDEDSCSSTCGWMIESPMLILNEGERVVSIGMNLTEESVKDLNQYGLEEIHLKGLFISYISHEEGWMELEPFVEYLPQIQKLQFTIKLEEDAPLTSACDKKVHTYATGSPAIRLLLKEGKQFAYDWAMLSIFDSITIQVKVDGIHNVNLCNEIGEQDLNVPFYPFGTQAKQGAWFVFQNKEMNIKPLIHITLKATWNQLPYGDSNSFAAIYKNYPYSPPITNQSFKVKTDWKENKIWHESAENNHELFKQASNHSIDENCRIDFTLNKQSNNRHSKTRDYIKSRELLFRVTLSSPSIGFGTEEYRSLFADTMIYNSRHKEPKVLPLAPVVPSLSKIEVSYTAEHTIVLNQITSDDKTMLYRMSSLSRILNYPIKSCEYQPLVRKLDDYSFLIGLENTLGENSVRIYFDLLPYKIDIFENRVSIGNTPELSWKYNKQFKWIPITLSDNTDGLTHSGYMELTLPEQISEENLDARGYLWLLMNIKGDVKPCLAVRSIFLNCITVKADGGDGSSLPIGTIKQSLDELPWVKDITQVSPGIKGKVAEDDKHLAARLAHRSAHRNRAINPSDYEQMIIERFPEIEQVSCIPRGGKYNVDHVAIVVLSRMDKTLFPNTPACLLADIKAYLTPYISPWANIDIINPTYERLEVECEFVAKEDQDIGMTILRMNKHINQYFALWMTECALPQINQSYSYKGLYTILANDEGIDELKELFVNGTKILDIDFDKEDAYIKGEYVWSIFVPKDTHIFRTVALEKEIDKAVIGENFIIG